jgi:dihydropteroate synthase
MSAIQLPFSSILRSSAQSDVLRPAQRRMPLVMGIVNVTPDSFSDGGVYFDRATAIEGALRMIEDGAAVVDIGGESTRPGADAVDAAAEMERVIPVIEAVRARTDAAISIDTRKSDVARAALDAGANVVNDVSALRHDPAMRALVRDRGVPAILMHMRGEPRTMQETIHFDDVVEEVHQELAGFRAAALEEGVEESQILIDPGIGFGKTFDHNVALLAHASRFKDLGPVVIGASRKAFIGHLTGQPGGPARMPGTLATIAAAADAGAALVRVHDVRAAVDFLKVLGAIRGA